MLPMLLNPSHVGTYCELMSVTPQQRIALSEGHREPGQLAIKLSDGTAILPVCGVIDYRPSWMTYYGYAVSSLQLRHEFAAMMADDTVKRIVFDIDSPGGMYSGVPELGKEIFASRGVKPTIAVANPSAASGALWIGAAADRFVVLGSGQVGSLGSLIVHTDMSRYYDMNGITHTILRSPVGKADFNSIEPLSDASREHHQSQINAITEEFQAAIAKYRGVNRAAAGKDFGQGRMLSAADAVEVGLCDAVVDSLESVIGKRGAAVKRARLNPRLELAKLHARN